MDKADRTSHGFTPISTSASIRLEGPRAGYDAMLHIYGKTSRTVAFRKTVDGYRWIGEQEIYKGPKVYSTVDGTFNEEIVVTYEIEPVSGHALNQLHIEYWGEDPRLKTDMHQDLTWRLVNPIIAEWKQSQ